MHLSLKAREAKRTRRNAYKDIQKISIEVALADHTQHRIAFISLGQIYKTDGQRISRAGADQSSELVRQAPQRKNTEGEQVQKASKEDLQPQP